MKMIKSAHAVLEKHIMNVSFLLQPSGYLTMINSFYCYTARTLKKHNTVPALTFDGRYTLFLSFLYMCCKTTGSFNIRYHAFIFKLHIRLMIIQLSVLMTTEQNL